MKPFKWRPSDVQIRLQDMNNMIDYMPDGRNPRRNKLTEDELKDVYVEAMPASFRIDCKTAGYDCANKTFVELDEHFNHLDEMSKSDQDNTMP